jgi:hypothetical protein
MINDVQLVQIRSFIIHGFQGIIMLIGGERKIKWARSPWLSASLSLGLIMARGYKGMDYAGKPKHLAEPETPESHNM